MLNMTNPNLMLNHRYALGDLQGCADAIQQALRMPNGARNHAAYHHQVARRHIRGPARAQAPRKPPTIGASPADRGGADQAGGADKRLRRLGPGPAPPGQVPGIRPRPPRPPPPPPPRLPAEFGSPSVRVAFLVRSPRRKGAAAAAACSGLGGGGGGGGGGGDGGSHGLGGVRSILAQPTNVLAWATAATRWPP